MQGTHCDRVSEEYKLSLREPFPTLSRQKERLVEYIRDSIVGDDRVIDGPFGPRRMIYADYTASGRCLSFIEKYLHDEVVPLYANTHTESSGTGAQTTHFREESRALILKAIGGDLEKDVLIFCGSGATGAINKLVEVLNIRLPADLAQKYQLGAQIPENERPVVFVGPYEHHSNELPWRESIATVVTIPETRDGHICRSMLEAQLQKYKDRPLKIGSFSAASNVTGIVSDTASVSILMHKYGGVVFWDFAAAGPYVDIEMNMSGPEESGADAALAYKDAIFISPHKFIGGPGSPGILVAKRALFRNSVPSEPGGGTVVFVNVSDHVYLSDIAHREEGGTPNILGSIKAGLVFQLKEAVGPAIDIMEQYFVRNAIRVWSQCKEIQILGNMESKRLSIVSFVLRHGTGFLHHNFVVALLNDLFGIQARGGCSCAGPYGHHLLGLDMETSRKMMKPIVVGRLEGIKPGWVRVNFNYFISETEFNYIISAVQFVSRHGWRFLPLYRFHTKSGMWTHVRPRLAPMLSLANISYANGRMEYSTRTVTALESTMCEYLLRAEQLAQRLSDADSLGEAAEVDEFPADCEELKWFPLPKDALQELIHGEVPLSKPRFGHYGDTSYPEHEHSPLEIPDPCPE